MNKATPYLGALAGAAVMTTVMLPLRVPMEAMYPGSKPGPFAMAFLLAVLFVATFWGIRPALLASVCGAFAFVFFFVPPYYSLTAEDPRDLIILISYLIVAITAGQLSERVRERTAAVETIRERLTGTQRRLQHIVASSPAVLFTLAVEGARICGVSWMSDNVQQMMGYTVEETLQPRWWIDNLHPDDRESVTTRVHGELFSLGHIANEYRFRHRDGGYRWIRSEKQLLRDSAGRFCEAVGSWSDITERKRAEESLWKHYRLLEAIIEGTNDVIFLKDRDGRYQMMNQAGAKLVGKTPTEVVGKNDAELFSPETTPRLMAVDQDILDSGNTLIVEEMVQAAGETRTYLSTKFPFRDPAGKIIGLIGIAHDITERKRAAESLTLFRALLDHTTDVIEVIDPETGRFLDVNEAACLAHGYTREEYLALSVPSIDPIAVRSPWPEHIAHLRSSGIRVIEGRHRRKDGSAFPVEVNINFVSLNRDYLVAVVRDITERRHAEEKQKNIERDLQQYAQRLVEIQETERRRIACELHDEIGQSLTGLKLLLEAAANESTLDRPLLPRQDLLKHLQQAQMLANELMDRVRALSLDLRPAILDDFGLLHALLWYFNRYESQIRIHVEFENDLGEKRFLPMIETAAYRIIQEALTNVARHAQIQKARVRITATPATLGVQIEDDGIGFDADAAPDPPTSGLAGMRERVLLLRGKLTIQSSPGRGTCVTAVFPLVAFPDEGCDTLSHDRFLPAGHGTHEEQG